MNSFEFKLKVKLQNVAMGCKKKPCLGFGFKLVFFRPSPLGFRQVDQHASA